MNSINKEAKVNKSKSEVKVEFSGKNLTPYGYGGLGLFNKFSRKSGVETALDKIRINESCEGVYLTGRKMMSLRECLELIPQSVSIKHGLKNTIFNLCQDISGHSAGMNETLRSF